MRIEVVHIPSCDAVTFQHEMERALGSAAAQWIRTVDGGPMFLHTDITATPDGQLYSALIVYYGLAGEGASA